MSEDSCTTKRVPGAAQSESPRPPLRVEVVKRDGLKQVRCWPVSFAGERKDRRYYELVEDTLHPDFDYRYFVIRDARDRACAVQPFFLLEQDLLAGGSPQVYELIERVRGTYPRFMRVRTLMVGSVAGEAHLDGDAAFHMSYAETLASSIAAHSQMLRAPLIVLKEFPERYRPALEYFVDHGFARIPSMPMTKLRITYASFDDYMQRALNSATRKKLRKKFEAASQACPIEMSIVDDVTPFIGQVYPLYVQVYRRSKLHFEKLTERYFCELGCRMRDKVRFFLWRQNGRIVAFLLCMLQGDVIYAEYIGLDYRVALDLHLYHYVVRDIISWAIANGYTWFHSSGL